MAKTTVVTLTDDLSGGEATQTVPFSFRGRDYEIDLNDANAKKFDSAMEKFIEKGRPSSSKSRPKNGGGGKKATARDFDLAALREWASKKGIQISPRGRIKQSIVEQFKSETGG